MNAHPSYLPGLLKLWRDGLVPRGGVVHVDVEHDDACAFLRVGVCTCHPFVSVRQEAA